MGEKTAIAWCDHTFNPWWGCRRLSPSCKNCYAGTFAENRCGELFFPASASTDDEDVPIRVTSAANWREPLKWDRKAAEAGIRRTVFCASMTDVFLQHSVARAARADLWELILKTPNLTWLLLTKRVQYAGEVPRDLKRRAWLGVTVENQVCAAVRLEALREHGKGFAGWFVSCEPLLGVLSLNLTGIDWVIAGGESGPHARPTHCVWAKCLRDDAVAARVPFLWKQWGEWSPRGPEPAYPIYDPTPHLKLSLCGHNASTDEDGIVPGFRPACPLCNTEESWMQRAGKHRTGNLLDGVIWEQRPKALESGPQNSAAAIAAAITPSAV